MKTGSSQGRQPFFDQTTIVNAVVDTPKGATFKLKFDEEWNVFRVNKAMPVGLAFPFNFGYLPSTEGGDGDALDIILLSEHVFPVGSVVLAKLIAILEAIQIERRHSQRNDRLIGIPLEVVSRKPMLPVTEFNGTLRQSITNFFIKYNELQGKRFRLLRYAGATQAIRSVRTANARWRKAKHEKS